MCCEDQSFTRYSVCARWSLFRWSKAPPPSNRKLSSPLALTGTHHFLKWVVFSTNLTKYAPIKLYHISIRLRAIILGCAVYYLLWLEFKIWLQIDVVLIFICFFVYVLAWHAQIFMLCLVYSVQNEVTINLISNLYFAPKLIGQSWYHIACL